jgi:hypothetical protein
VERGSLLLIRQCHCNYQTSDDVVVVVFILLTCHGKNSKLIIFLKNIEKKCLFMFSLEHMDEMWNSSELLPVGRVTLGS